MENQENQQPNTPQPDYSFILNQPGPAGQPAPSSGLPPKRHKKLLILLGGLIVLAILLVAMALSGNKSPQNTASTQTAASPLSASPVQDFLAAIQSGNYQSAASMLPHTSDDPTVAQQLTNLFSPYDLNSCMVSNPQGNQTISSSDLTCNRKDGKYKVQLHFRIAQANNGPLILDYTVGVIK